MEIPDRFQRKSTVQQHVNGTSPTPIMQAAQTQVGSDEIELSSDQHEILYSDASVGETELEAAFGKYKMLASDPKPGSVLYILKSHKIGLKEMNHFFTDIYIKRSAPLIIDPDVDLHTYVLYSLVLPHASAITLSEDVQAAVSKGADHWSLLSRMSGHNMKDRGDLFNLIRAVLRRYPKVLDYIMPTRHVVKS